MFENNFRKHNYNSELKKKSRKQLAIFKKTVDVRQFRRFSFYMSLVIFSLALDWRQAN